MNYHVRIKEQNKPRKETKVDLAEDELHSRFIEPYKKGEPIIINGRTIVPDDLERIEISQSEESSEEIIKRLKAEDRNSSVTFLGGPSYKTRAAGRAESITDELIKGAPGYGKEEMEQSNDLSENDKSSTKVFVVHGHDHELKNETEVFLKNIGLEPIVLHREADEGLTIIEKFEKHADVSFALVLLTPDDIGYPINEQKKDEEKRNIEYRARQNVIFELGYFAGVLGRSNVCYLYKENVEIPSDLEGLIYKKVDSSIEEVGFDLIKEFKAAGLDVNIDNL